jgi:hypothetical protein
VQYRQVPSVSTAWNVVRVTGDPRFKNSFLVLLSVSEEQFMGPAMSVCLSCL